jgi:hypothetical protein
MRLATVLFTAIVMTGASTPIVAQDSNPSTLTSKQCTLPGNDRIVPNILGFAPDKAREIVEACGFVWDGATDVHTMSYEEIGKVGDQQPSGGTVRKAKTTVRGFISSGMFAPSFIGWKKDDAVAYIKDLRHGYIVAEQRNAAPIGTVFDQSPQNSIKYNSGLPVTIFVSIGLYVNLPNIIGVKYQNATNIIKNLKLSAVHGGGDLSVGSKKITSCEWMYWYPVVERIEPTGLLYEGQTVTVFTRRETQTSFGIPAGVTCE